MPAKGFRSKAERRIYKLLSKALPSTAIETEYFVKTEGQRLFFDLYLPTFKVAIEIQGEQHYEEVPFFHGNSEEVRKINFSNQKERDRIKRELTEYGLGLIILDYKEAMSINEMGLIKLLKKEVARRDSEF